MVYHFLCPTIYRYITYVGETGGHWDTGSIGTPPLIENPSHTEHMRCNFLDAQEPPLYRSIRTKKIVQYKRVGEWKQLFDPSS